MDHHNLTLNKQSNAIIFSRQEFTAIEKKIFFHVINQMNPKYGVTQNIFQELVFDIPLKDIGIKNHKHIRDVCSKLMSRKLRLRSENNDFHIVVPFYEAQYNDKLKLVQLKLAPSAVPSFLDLKQGFTMYAYELAMDLTSSYSQRFYELLAGWNRTDNWCPTIEQLREYLALDGAYKKAYEFKRNVLDVAQLELEAKADIYFDYTLIRKNKVVTHVEFIIHRPKAEAKLVAEKFLNDVGALSPGEQMTLLEQLFLCYTFREDQKDKIRRTGPLIGKLFEIHSRIETGLVNIKKDKTALVVKHLNLK